MDKIFVERFMSAKEQLKTQLSKAHPDDYKDLVALVIQTVTDDSHGPDPERIHLIDDGEYQGVLVFIIAAKGYQPSDYWYVKVSYGSCSGCDTLEAIREYSSEPPTDSQIDDYLTLALHIVQQLKKMGDGEA